MFRGLLSVLMGVASLGTGLAVHAQAGEGSDLATRIRQAGRVEAAPRLYRSAQCPKCEGEVLELAGELVSDEGVPVILAEGEEVVMSYRTADGTALAGVDYAETTGTLTFTAQEQNPLITVETFEDQLNEADEFFTVTLLPAVLPDGSRTDKLDSTLTIFDDDGLTATLSAEQPTVEEGAPATFRVELSGGTSTAPVVVNYQVTVSSTVTAGTDYAEPSGSLTIAAGAESGSFTIATLDDEMLERDERLEVHLPEECCFSAGSIKPSEADVPVSVTVRDNDVVQVSIGEATAGGATAQASEGEPVRFVVQLTRAAPEMVAVSYRTGNGSGVGAATAGRDYIAAGGTLRFAPGAALAQTITVVTTEDQFNEGPERFTVTLSDGGGLPAGVSLASDGRTATGEIVDDDELTAAVRADAAHVVEGESATYTVELGGGVSTAPVVVAYSVAGTATETSDYAPTSGSLTIGAGRARGTITVATRVDGGREPDETLVVRLQAASTVGAATVDPTPAATTIVDVDSRSITIADAEGVEGDGRITFEVRLVTPSSVEVAVSYRTEDGTAQADEDYQAAAGSVTVAAGASSATITVRVVDDKLDEPDPETFSVRLSDPVAGKLAAEPTAVGSIRDDDDPPGISIADASARESEGEIAFPVHLATRSGLPVTVSYHTEDGTAQAGEDYETAAGSLTFVAGETRGTIRVDVIHDTLKEPDETFRVRLSAAVNGELPGEAAATGTIVNDDEAVERVWLARFGRTVAIHVVDVVSDRVIEGSAPPEQVTFAGRRLQPTAAAVAHEHPEGMVAFRTLEGHELVAGSSFHLASVPGEEGVSGNAGTWAGWGRGGVTRLVGEETKAELALRGTVVTAAVGVDYDWGPVLTGLALAYSGAGADFWSAAGQLHPRNGTAGSWLVSAHPYASVTVLDGLELWGLLGYGLGGMTLTEDADVETAIRVMMAGLGVRGTLLTPRANAGFGVVIASDGLVMRANADGKEGQQEVEADAIRGRLRTEGSYNAQLGDGSVLTPVVEVGIRYDVGHAEEGVGAELGGGVSYHKPEWGLTATASGGFVLTHQEHRFQEWNLGGAVRLSSDPAGRGVTLDVDSSWGTAAGGADVPVLLALQEVAPAGQVDVELGYGVGVVVLGRDALLVPYVGVTAAGGAMAYRVGSRADLGSSFSVSLEGERYKSSGAVPVHGVTLRGSVRW